ncbi:MAG: hypothetical protein QOK37_1465 [Thermoanaerobaculia bacterium]|jgi:hypothetical protein|nr:hypothetical protein [Thermoanaerobaculia bacterium]
MIIISYSIYLVLSISVTIWVGRTLHRNGRVFLLDSFLGNETLADSVNHLLLAGFYLINAGYVSLALKYGHKPETAAEAIEYLSTKIGVVLLVLGLMHFINVKVFASMRRRALDGDQPPVQPQQYVAPPVGA